MKVAVIYASTTGNTEAMAKAIQDGLTSGGAQVSLLKAGSVSASDAAGYDMLILGSPAMGAEVLEEEEMEPFFSYDWGDGEWMRTWEDRVRSAGAKLFKDAGLIVHLTPEAEDIEKCTAFGKEAAAF